MKKIIIFIKKMYYNFEVIKKKKKRKKIEKKFEKRKRKAIKLSE